MLKIDASSPIMITGATGYLAGWIVKGLLEEGVTIHAAVRDPNAEKKVQHLHDMAKTAPGEIKLFKADLLDEGSYADAMTGCATVFHTASPFINAVNDPQKELVDPAKLGTRNVLEQANRTASVRRVVLTSSVAAIYGDNADVAKAPGGILTEDIWNTSSSLDHQPYNYSKTVAEREAWRIADAQDRWDLVVINPSFVIGPGTSPNATSESFRILKQFGDGSMKSGAPRWGIGVVDVRDVALAHIAAAFTQSAKGRHIVSETNTDFFEMGKCLLDKYGGNYPIPRRALPKAVLWLVGPIINKVMTRKAVLLNANFPWQADNSKSIRELGMTYRPMKVSMEEMFQQIIDTGHFKRN